MNRAAIPASHLEWFVHFQSDLFCPEQNKLELSAYKPSAEPYHLQSDNLETAGKFTHDFAPFGGYF